MKYFFNIINIVDSSGKDHLFPNDRNVNIFDIYDLLTYKLKNTKVSKNKYSNVISFIDLNDDILLESDHIFFPTFNQDILPHIHKDDGYLSDKELEVINLI